MADDELLERSEQRALIESALRRARSGDGGVLFIEGAAGMHGAGGRDGADRVQRRRGVARPKPRSASTDAPTGTLLVDGRAPLPFAG